MVIPLRLDRPPSGETMRVLLVAGGDRYCPVYGASSSQRARGLGSTWTTFHLAHEAKIAELLGIPSTVSQWRCSQSRFTREILSIPHQDVLLMK